MQVGICKTTRNRTAALPDGGYDAFHKDTNKRSLGQPPKLLGTPGSEGSFWKTPSRVICACAPGAGKPAQGEEEAHTHQGQLGTL